MHRFSAPFLALGLLFPSLAAAQSRLGGEIIVPPVATGEEQSAQADLWVMEVRFKPLRMITVELTDPKTGEKKPEFVWYLAYRGFVRPLPDRGNANQPQNTLDEPVSPPLFIPEFTLVTTDTPERISYPDQVIPEALPVINRREKYDYGTSVSVVGPIPPAAAPGATDVQGVAGVAMWRNLDPSADRFTVFLTGFSNGIQVVTTPDGGTAVQSKTIQQDYWRPGDQFDLDELEMKLDGESVWIYR
ncbi:MAG: hypothetical protein KF777_22690 [Planctomycetaceae bacterium]|nr:hypothetical protein [Planctomycetaceae bacterium]